MPEATSPNLAEFFAAWDLFREPVHAAVAAGSLLGFLSMYVVLRRMIFLSVVVSQMSALGVASAFYLRIHHDVAMPPEWLALILSLSSLALLAWLPERLHVWKEPILGVAYALSGALVVLVGSKITQEAHDIQGLLFGTAVMVDEVDCRLLRWLAMGLLPVHLYFFRALAFANLDSVSARVQGLPTTWLQLFVLFSVGGAIGAASKALGALPVFALASIPALAGLALPLGPLGIALLGMVIGATSGALGYVLSFLHGLPVGATQAAACTGISIGVGGVGWLAERRRSR